ncbi:MAG: hypothetical protein RQ736_13055 [Thiogranum sp.]|nr:hypothetical protein [Thiogranum sp.]
MKKVAENIIAAGVACGITLAGGIAQAHDGGNDAGTPVCLEANYMVADAQNAPFASVNGPGRVIERNIITGERGITVNNPFTAANVGTPICPPEMECPGPWKPTGNFSGGLDGHAFITSAGQQALTEFHRDGTPIRTLSYRPITGNPTGPAGRGTVPRPLGTQILPNGNLVQAICDANFFNAQNSDPDPDSPTGLAADTFFPPVFSTPERAANSRLLVIDQETMQVIDEYTQPARGDLGHDLWGCMAGILVTSDGMYVSTFHGGAVLVIDWKDGVSGSSGGVGSNDPGNFTLDRKANRAKVTQVIDFVGGPVDNPHRRDTHRAISMDESGNLYATNRRRSQECLRGEIGPGGCNPGVFRQRISIDWVTAPNDDANFAEDATIALDPGINVIAGNRVSRMSARGCDFVQAEAVANGMDPNSREVAELCGVETLYVAASAVNPGCENTGPNAANQCFTPGGYVLEYRIDPDHVDGGNGKPCTGDPNDGFGAGEGNEGCALPIATFGGAVNGEDNLDPRMLMPIQRAFIQ